MPIYELFRTFTLQAPLKGLSLAFDPANCHKTWPKVFAWYLPTEFLNCYEVEQNERGCNFAETDKFREVLSKLILAFAPGGTAVKPDTPGYITSIALRNLVFISAEGGCLAPMLRYKVDCLLGMSVLARQSVREIRYKVGRPGLRQFFQSPVREADTTQICIKLSHRPCNRQPLLRCDVTFVKLFRQ